MRRPVASPGAQRGVALITVLLVFAIASIIATKVILAKTIDVKRVTHLVNQTQAYYYALATEQLVMLALREDAKNDADNQHGDHLQEAWASGITLEIDPFSSVSVSLIDLNRFYNLNNIIHTGSEISNYEVERFRDLLIELNIDESLADNLRDWMDSDNREEGYLSENDSYRNEPVPYLAGNQRLTDVSELRLVRGFTPEVIELLAPHVTVVKSSGVEGVLPINVNTASEYVLATLQTRKGNTGDDHRGIGYTGGQDIVSARSEPIHERLPESLGNNLNLIGESLRNDGQSYSPSKSTFDFSSTYYEVNIRAIYAGTTTYLTSLLYQKGGGPTPAYVVLSRREVDNSKRFVEGLSQSSVPEGAEAAARAYYGQ